MVGEGGAPVGTPVVKAAAQIKKMFDDFDEKINNIEPIPVDTGTEDREAKLGAELDKVEKALTSKNLGPNPSGKKAALEALKRICFPDKSRN